MKNQLSKGLHVLIIAVMMFSISANAQIVYTDVNPDSTSSGTYNLDLNNDGINDFTLRKTSSFHVHVHCITCAGTMYVTPTTISIQPVGSNAIGLNGGSSKLNSNTVINSAALSWSDTTLVILSKTTYSTLGTCLSGFNYCIPNGTQSGNWIGATNKYLGLKINVGSDTYYGWVQLTVTGSSSFTVKNYAYNTIGNQSILAGQTCSPLAGIIANGPLTFCSGGSVDLTSKNTGNTLKYQWKKNNVNINGATAKNYTATTAGDYKVKVTDTLNNCSKTSGIKTVTIPCRLTNENVMETPGQLSVFPNPATNSVTIKFPSDETGEIQIINLYGQVVYSEKINTGQTRIDVSKMSAGMYIIKWNSGEDNETKIFSVTK